MSSPPPHKRFCCSLCTYTTNKKYNLDRHTGTVHFQPSTKVAETSIFVAPTSTNVAPTSIFVAPTSTNVALPSTFVAPASTNVALAIEENTKRYKCDKCYKSFSKLCTLTKHQELGICKQILHPYTCDLCKVQQTSRYALSRHRKHCTGTTTLVPIEGSTSSSNTISANNMNIGVQNNVQTQNNIQNQNNILIFPMSDEASEKFDYITDHINIAKLQEFIKQRKPSIGFNKFVSEVLDNPQNRNVQKTNIKDRYSKVHIGDDKWELAMDSDVYPIMTHHMTTAALGKMEEHKTDIPKSIKQKAAEFVEFIDQINTTDEGDVYNETVERIKLILVNLCNLKL